MKTRWLVALAFSGSLASCDEDDGPDGPTMCTQDDDCGSNDICQSEQCVAPECTETADCDAGSECSAGRCIAPYWVVGDDGVVLRALASGEHEVHSVGITTRFNAIECLGSTRAWVVGDGGIVMTTFDGGASWTRIEVPVARDFVSVSASDRGPVAIAGDDVLLWSPDGVAFEIASEAVGALRAVSTDGQATFAVDATGGLWRFADGVLERQSLVDIELLDVDITHDGTTIAVAGRAGTLLWSPDAGASWEALPVDTTADLWAVQISVDGGQAIAAGDHGTVITLRGGQLETSSIGAIDLRDVHLDGLGRGAAVGLGGAIVLTLDAGRSFHAAASAPVDLLGVDAIGSDHW